MYHHTFYQLEHWAEHLEDFLEVSMLANSITSLLSLAAYILGALGLYYMAKRRGIAHAWLSWIPIGNLWILGSLSDQYQWVAKGENRKKRKTLLTLSCVSVGLGILAAILVVAAVFCVLQAAVYGGNEDAMIMAAVGLVMGVVLVGLGLAGVGIALVIIRYIALYDVYMSANPEHGVMFLLLSIFIHLTEGFFLFFNREKDKGMVRQQAQSNDWGSNQNFRRYDCNYRPESEGQGTYQATPPSGEAQDPWNRQ